MRNLNRLDLVLEADLYQSLQEQINEQLSYYRASVYKTETACVIEDKVEHKKAIFYSKIGTRRCFSRLRY